MTQVAAAMLDHPSRPPAPLIREGRKPFNGDRLLRTATAGSSLLIVAMLATLIAVLAWASIPSIKAYGIGFLTESTWRPNELERPQRTAGGKVVFEDGEMVMETIPPSFGALPVIWGTAVSSAIALIVAVPLSLGAALFLIRLAPRMLAGPVSFMIEFLAAIPSIAYGIWGIFVLTPFLQGHVKVPGWLAWTGSAPGLDWMVQSGPDYASKVPGQTAMFFKGLEPLLRDSVGKIPGLGWMFYDNGTPLPLTGRDMLCGGLILAIMVLPIITAIARDVLKAVPRAQIEGTLALGATWWQSSWEMLRYSRAGLFGAVMLGLARAAGETMAVTMVIGNASQVNASVFAPAQTMSSLLANEFGEAGAGLHTAALSEVALILLLMSLIFNVVARWLVVGRK